MIHKVLIVAVLRVTARVLNVLIVGFLLLFLFGEGVDEMGILHLFFPSGVLLGLVIAWFAEKTGAGISIGSIGVFYFVHFLLAGALPGGPFFPIAAAPGILYVTCAFLEGPRSS